MDVPRPPEAPPTPPPLPEEVAKQNQSAADSLSPHLRDSLIDLELDQTWVVFWLSLSAVALAVISLGPVVYRWLHSELATEWDRWMFLLLFFGLLQLAYVLLFVQLPFWFTLRSSSIFSLILASCYAAGLAVFTFSRLDSQWVVWLDLADEQQMGTAQRWCLVMVCLSLPVAYYQGKVSAQWRERELER